MSEFDDQSQNRNRQNPSDDLSGRRLGGYRLLSMLGRGAMAEVYLAEQESLKRRVAIKILKPELAVDAAYRARFQREAEAAASLVHANIVQIHEVGCVDGVNFIAQEYVEGQNLRQWIADNPKPDLPRAISIIHQVAAALAKAAEQKIVHRDIKPENILIKNSGEVKVADFGLARLPGQGDGVDITRVGITLGTPLYMSPEQIEGKTLDPRSDIYSFGVTCYHMLAGRPPFSGHTSLGVALQHLKKDPPALTEIRDDLPPELCRIVHRALAKKPADRYQSAAALMQDLHRLMAEMPSDFWPENLSPWTSAGLDNAALAPSSATQRIQALMDGSQKTGRFRLSQAMIASTALAAFLLGGIISWFAAAPADILEGGLAAQEALPPVPREETVLMQWIAAVKADSEGAWLALVEYYPEKKNYVRRAQQQLARLYLREGDDVRALEAFRRLADADPADRELQAFGQAGECIVLSRLGKKKEFNSLYKTLEPNLPNLKDEQLARQLRAAAKAGR